MDEASAPAWNCFVFSVCLVVPRFYFEWLVQEYSAAAEKRFSNHVLQQARSHLSEK